MISFAHNCARKIDICIIINSIIIDIHIKAAKEPPLAALYGVTFPI